MKLFRTEQIAEIDQYTIKNEPIPDIDLMERASVTVFQHIINETAFSGKVAVFCGPGNNGGDGLAIARMLASVSERFTVHVFVVDFGRELTGSSSINLKRAREQGAIRLSFLRSTSDLPEIDSYSLLLDALFGSGLNRPLSGLPLALVKQLNRSGVPVIAVDIPSGLMGEDNTGNDYEGIIQADETITFQFPKLSFLFAENERFIGKWIIKDIGLSVRAIEETETHYRLLQESDVREMIKPRSRFAHKGTLGHALLIAGSYGMMGAAVLASKSCLRSGVGLVTTHLPRHGYEVLQASLPEALTSIDESDIMFTSFGEINKYSAIGAGPGIGTKQNTCRGIKQLIEKAKVPLVLDADALNILSVNSEWMSLVPQNTIFTPHPGEFDRLTGSSANSFQRLAKAVEFAVKHKIILVLKGAHTAIVNHTGDVHFNITGNNGMATAGSGDVLTGIILSLLAQGYAPINAAMVGVYLHGLAGDFAAEKMGFEALIASDIVDGLGQAFQSINKKT